MREEISRLSVDGVDHRVRNRGVGAAAGLAVLLSAAGAFGQFVVPNNDDTADRNRARAAAMATARAEVRQAESRLNVATLRVQANWKANPQYLDSVKERDAANKAYQSAKDGVVAHLKTDSQYANAKDDVDDSTRDVQREQEKVNATQPASAPFSAAPPTPSANQIAAAQDKLNDKTKLRKIVDDAVAADPDAAKAKARLDQANDTLQLMQAQLQAALLNDPDYKAAFDQLTAAKAHVTSAAASN